MIGEPPPARARAGRSAGRSGCRAVAPGRRWRLVAAGTALLAGAWLGAAPVRADEVEIPIIEPTDDPATFLFNPEAVTVGVGDEVTWINSGRREHRVRAEDGSFDSGPLRPGGGWRFTPTAGGSIGYFCPIFPEMRGSLTVTIAAPSTTPDGPPSAGAPADGPRNGRAARGRGPAVAASAGPIAERRGPAGGRHPARGRAPAHPGRDGLVPGRLLPAAAGPHIERRAGGPAGAGWFPPCEP
jgi:plastocyanin